MDALVLKLLVMVGVALLVTIALIGLELRTHTGSRTSYTLQGVVGIVLLGVLVSLLTVR